MTAYLKYAARLVGLFNCSVVIIHTPLRARPEKS